MAELKSREEARLRDLKAETERLKAELDEAKFGAKRLLNQAQVAFDATEDADAHMALIDLMRLHPNSPEAKDGLILLRLVNARIDARITKGAQQKRQEAEGQKKLERVAIERATLNLKKRTDAIDGITWMSHKGAPILGKYASLYFGTRDGSASGYPIRLQVQYYGDDWLFVRSLTIKADGRTYELSGLDFKRDNSSGSIWEWIDIPVTDQEMLARWVSSKEVVIRFHGNNYNSDFSQPQGQRNQMKEVYSAWTALGGVAR